MSNASPKSGWSLFLSIIVVILALVVVIIVVYNCCGDEQPVAGTAVELIIEDAHSGVWMPFDNGWTKLSKTSWTKWDGIVIQLGKFFTYNQDGDKGYTMESSWIKFENQDGASVSLNKGDFDWLNIISEHPASWQPPITTQEGYALFPNQITATMCDVVDSCPDLGKLPPPATDCTADLTKVPQPCLRMRSLHATFEPYAVITYWQGDGGYDLTAEHNTADHNAFVFNWPDEISGVEVYLEGAHVTAKESAIAGLGKITKITLAIPSDTPHGDMDDPPMSFSKK